MQENLEREQGIQKNVSLSELYLREGRANNGFFRGREKSATQRHGAMVDGTTMHDLCVLAVKKLGQVFFFCEVQGLTSGDTNTTAVSSISQVGEYIQQ